MIALLLAAGLQAGPTDALAVRPAVDFTIAGLGLAGWAIPELLHNDLAPSHCRICDGPDGSGLPGSGSRGSLNGVDAWFHDAMTSWLLPRETANTVSDVWGFALMPAAALAGAYFATGPTASDGAGLRAGLIVLESSAVSASVIQGIKFFAARKRPFVRYGDGASSGPYDVTDNDSHLSFPSGHTAFATALGVSMAMTATLQDSPAAPWLWGAAAAMSVSTASLRMMAEKHYFTDVLTGALVGAASGVVFPLLHRRGSALAVGPQGSSAIAVSGVF
jgi:membrane-associated phospholipid phosphatase